MVIEHRSTLLLNIRKSLFYLSIIPLLVICGCSTTSHPCESTVGNQPFHLVLVRPFSDSGWAVRLPVQLDGKDIAKLKNGSYMELTLQPGTYALSSRRGALFGHDFPLATTTVTGVAGERRFLAYVMEYGPKIVSYPVAPGVDMKGVTAQPFKAEWQEMSKECFQRTYADSK